MALWRRSSSWLTSCSRTPAGIIGGNEAKVSSEVAPEDAPDRRQEERWSRLLPKLVGSRHATGRPVQALKEFFAMLTNDSTRACYGPKHVEVAHERLAIQALLMTDTLFRNTDIASSHQPLIVPN
ncbi:hypothetical protein ZWY2020_017508 [Hordeum vulgare]|nr:hypothetical protein ZWY2020_017508 [Hordeum vulgare]